MDDPGKPTITNPLTHEDKDIRRLLSEEVKQ